MKKLVPFGPLMALGSGVIAMLLRFWMLTEGTDSSGLYPRFHPGWVLSCILALVMPVCFLLLSRQVDPERPYEENFPASPLGAAGHLLAAVGIGIVSVQSFLSGPSTFEKLLNILGLACCLLLALGGWLRLQGRKHPFLLPALLTLYFALRIFYMGKILGAEPEMSRFLLQFMANLSMLLACYQLWGFAVGSGNRQKSLFWSLTAGFFCFAAVPGAAELPLYAGMGLWLVLDLCALQPKKAVEEAEASETPATEAEVLSDDTENESI